MKPKIKGFSLRWGLLGIVIGCWLLPMALTLAPLAYYTTQSVRRQFDQTVRASISNAAANCRRNINAAVEASRKASYDGKIRSAYLRYTQNKNSQVFYESINSYLIETYRYNDIIPLTLVFLHDEPMDIYYTFNPMLASYSWVLEYQADVHKEVLQLCENLGTYIAFINVKGNVYMVRNIVDTNYNPFATIVLQLDLDAVIGSFKNILWETNAVIYLNDVPINAIIEAPQLEFPYPENLRLSPGEYTVVENTEHVNVYGRESTDAVDILYAVEIDLKGFIRGFFNFNGMVYILLTLTVPLLLLAILFFYHNIFKPIDRLIFATGKIQDGHLGYQTDTHVGNREFEYLNEAFNSMSLRLKKQFERIYNEELALRDARIMALQSQINPHFLNNTLEIINWEVRLGSNAKVSKMIESLAIMLDAAMDRKSSPLVTLAQEIMYVDAYLYIIAERYGKRLKVSKQIDHTLLQYKVPRLILQPIIENAVEHGIDIKQAGIIEITAEKLDGGINLGVKNNSPMSQKDVESVKKLLSPDYDARTEGSLHLGIHNVNLRLKMIYGEISSLSITSDGENTLSSIFIPIGDEIIPWQ